MPAHVSFVVGVASRTKQPALLDSRERGGCYLHEYCRALFFSCVHVVGQPLPGLQPVAAASGVAHPITSPGLWTCPRCTLSNELSASECDACASPPPPLQALDRPQLLPEDAAGSIPAAAVTEPPAPGTDTRTDTPRSGAVATDGGEGDCEGDCEGGCG